VKFTNPTAPSTEIRYMVRSKLELHLGLLPHLPLPRELTPEAYTNARIAINATFSSQHERDEYLRLRSLSDLLRFLIRGKDRHRFQVEVSATAARVHLLSPDLLGQIPVLGSKLNDLSYLRIGEFKWTYQGPEAEDFLIAVLERLGGLGLSPESVPRDQLTAPSALADLQRYIVKPWEWFARRATRQLQAPATATDDDLSRLSARVSDALRRLARPLEQVAPTAHRYTSVILRSASKLDHAVARGLIGREEAERIAKIAKKADRVAKQLRAPIKRSRARDAKAEARAKQESLLRLIRKISDLLPKPPPTLPPPAGGTTPAPPGPPGSGSGGRGSPAGDAPFSPGQPASADGLEPTDPTTRPDVRLTAEPLEPLLPPGGPPEFFGPPAPPSESASSPPGTESSPM
jgi:hypothetical protein